MQRKEQTGIVNCDMGVVRISTAFNIDLEFEIAGMHRRLLAYLIDFALLICYLYLMKYLLYKVIGAPMEATIGIDIMVISLPMLLYSLVSEISMNGQTLGKKLMAIRVISLEGGEPTIGQYITRWITKFFEWPLLFGYILVRDFNSILVFLMSTGMLGIAVVIIISVTPKNQRLGDLAAGTAVVDAKSGLGVIDTVFMQVSQENYTVLFPEVMRLSDNDINTINLVLNLAKKNNNYDTCLRVAAKVKQVLGIQTQLHTIHFLEKLMEDYNYLATRE